MLVGVCIKFDVNGVWIVNKLIELVEDLIFFVSLNLVIMLYFRIFVIICFNISLFYISDLLLGVGGWDDRIGFVLEELYGEIISIGCFYFSVGGWGWIDWSNSCLYIWIV